MSVSNLHVLRETLRGKTIARILVNESLSRHFKQLRGDVLDLAGGVQASYLRLVPPGVHLLQTNHVASAGVTAVDFNKPLPFADASFDAVLLINAIYIAEDQYALAKEIHRILKSGGVWLLVSPFISNEMKEPNDYLRLTHEGIERLCKTTGYEEIQIERVGERATAAVYLLQPFFFPDIIRAFVYMVAMSLDRWIPERVKREHPTPISYVVVCKKSL